MNISYTGKRPELPPDHQRKLDLKWEKIAKLIEWKGQREAHVVITTERHLTNVEINCNFYDHALVGLGSGGDFLTAVQTALEKLEKQALKVRTKFRDTKRLAKDKSVEGAGASDEGTAANPPAQEAPAIQVFPVDHHDRRKPMTLDEAMMEIDGHPYIVYRDSDKDCVSVLIRRADGNFDLVEP
jgi:ribosomal subunit interface protein